MQPENEPQSPGDVPSTAEPSPRPEPLTMGGAPNPSVEDPEPRPAEGARSPRIPIERVQLGVRLEKRMAKVLKATAEYLDRSLGELLETIVLHAFEGSSPFTEKTLQSIAELKKVYGMEYDLNALPRFMEESVSWQRFTEGARRAVFAAQEEAAAAGDSYVGTDDLLLGIVSHPESMACRLLARLELPVEEVRRQLLRECDRAVGSSHREMRLTPRARRVIDLAYEEARQLGGYTIGTDHLLLGIVREEGEKVQREAAGTLKGQGVLDVLPDGWGFLRRHADAARSPDDIYVSQAQIQRFGLKTGDWVSGQVRPPKGEEKYFGLLRVESVNPTEAERPPVYREFRDRGGAVLVRLGATLERAREAIEGMQTESQG